MVEQRHGDCCVEERRNKPGQEDEPGTFQEREYYIVYQLVKDYKTLEEDEQESTEVGELQASDHKYTGKQMVRRPRERSGVKGEEREYIAGDEGELEAELGDIVLVEQPEYRNMNMYVNTAEYRGY